MIKINTLYSLSNISDCYYINDNLQIINKNTGYIKKQTLGKRGYYYVTLNNMQNKQVKVPVHKIVALAFICNEKFEVINHKDGNKLNNSIENLEFCTQQHNVNHAWDNGLATRNETLFQIIYLNNRVLVGTIKSLVDETSIPKGTLYDCYYKNKGSKLHNIKSVKVYKSNKSPETIEKVCFA